MKIKYSNGKIQDVPGAFGSMFVTAGLATPYWEEAPARDFDSFKPTQVGTADTRAAGFPPGCTASRLMLRFRFTAARGPERGM
jgi:hypothetical protein